MMPIQCRAVGCTEAHFQHHCRICGDRDSNHRSADCPKGTGIKFGCKARGCTENHPRHHCRACGDRDANHRSANCPKAFGKGKKKSCKAQGCTENHSWHHCRLCDNYNSDHLSRDCPKGTVLYHGTRISNVSGISAAGLCASTSGRLGPGVYFTTKEEAIKIARHRNTGTGVAVFRCTVDLGNCIDLGINEDYTGSWQQNYDSCTSIHPPWAGNPNFREWCLKDESKLRISGLFLLDGEIDGDLDLLNADIFVSGTVTLKGKINAKKLTTGVGF